MGTAFLHNVSLFANLSSADLEPLAQRLKARRFRPGEEVLRQGSPSSSLYIVKAGLVDIIVTGSDHQQQTVAQFGPGQAFGEFALLDGLPRSAGAVARERTELLILTRPDFFMYLEQHPAVAVNLLVLLSRRLRFAMQRTEGEPLPQGTCARLAEMLVNLAERYGQPKDGATELAIRLTQGELAGMLGCTRAQVEEAMTKLHAMGLVDLRGLHVLIHDLDGLRREAVRE